MRAKWTCHIINMFSRPACCSTVLFLPTPDGFMLSHIHWDGPLGTRHISAVTFVPASVFVWWVYGWSRRLPAPCIQSSCTIKANLRATTVVHKAAPSSQVLRWMSERSWIMSVMVYTTQRQLGSYWGPAAMCHAGLLYSWLLTSCFCAPSGQWEVLMHFSPNHGICTQEMMCLYVSEGEIMCVSVWHVPRAYWKQWL